jgi:hypothetical protein
MGVSIDVDLDLSGLEGQIQRIKREIKSIDDELEINVDVDTDKIEEKLGGGEGDKDERKESDLSGSAFTLRDLHDLISDSDGGDSSDGGGDDGPSDRLKGMMDLIGKRLPDPDVDPKTSVDLSGADTEKEDDSVNKRLKDMLSLNIGRRDERTELDPEGGLSVPGVRSTERTRIAGDLDFPKPDATEKFRRSLNDLKGAAGDTRKKLSILRPTVGGIYAAFAATIPVIIGATGAILGLGVGLAGLAAGGAIAALGLLGGQASTLEGSMASAEDKMKSFKKEMFQTFQPVADRFEPMVDRAFSQIQTHTSDLTDDALSLGNTFGPFLISAIGPAVNLIERLAGVFVEMAPTLKAIASGLGQFISQNLPGFLKGLMKEGAKSVGMLKGLGTVVFNVIWLIYSVSKAVSTFISALAPLSVLVGMIASVLGSDLFQGFVRILGILTTIVAPLAAAVGLLWLMNNAALATAIAMNYLGGSILGTVVGSMIKLITLIPSLWAGLTAVQKVLWSMAAAVSILTAGFAAIAGLGAIGGMLSGTPGGAGGGGPGSGSNQFGGGMSGGPGGSTTINVYGDVDNATQEDFRTKAERANGEFGKMSGNFNGN